MKICDELRQAVLQAAIQGKLTRQRKEDGDARDLLKHIAEEKAKLIKEKKIKKEKPLAEITEDEIPFDIPENWVWIRLPDIGELNRGKSKWRPRNDPRLYENGTIPFIQTGDVARAHKYIRNFTTVYNEFGLSQSRLWTKGTICLTIAANIGDVAILDFDACFPDSVVGFNAFKPIENNEFFLYGLMAYKQIFDELSRSTAQKNINLEILSSVAFPLPPLAEQQRIVAKVDKLMAEIDELEKIENELIALKEAFPRDMKAALLQAAMQGKLTEQLKTDGSARDLLNEIKAEKETLVKAGKLKKAKPLDKITEDEIPFDIPENWEWVRLGSVSTYAETKFKINALNADENMWLLDLEDIEKGGRLLQKKIVKDSGAKGDKTVFNNNDILYSKLRPYLKKVLIADAEGICTPELIPFKMYGNIEHRYVVKYLVSPFVDKFINDITYGVKMPRVGTDTMVNLVFPLPPFAEQKRIVAKLDKLLPLCESLL